MAKFVSLFLIAMVLAAVLMPEPSEAGFGLFKKLKLAKFGLFKAKLLGLGVAKFGKLGLLGLAKKKLLLKPKLLKLKKLKAIG